MILTIYLFLYCHDTHRNEIYVPLSSVFITALKMSSSEWIVRKQGMRLGNAKSKFYWTLMTDFFTFTEFWIQKSYSTMKTLFQILWRSFILSFIYHFVRLASMAYNNVSCFKLLKSPLYYPKKFKVVHPT